MIDMSIPGQMSRAELLVLEDLARQVPPNGVVVELGSLYGRSSFTWATTVLPSVTVYCVDPWERDGWIIDLVEKQHENCPPFSFQQFQQYTRGLRNIKPIVGRSPDDVKTWTQPVDLYFDDSMHHNPHFRKNLYFWLRQMKPNSIMCGHDYCSKWPDVCTEVDELARILGTQVHVEEWVWWIKLPPRIRLSAKLRAAARHSKDRS